MFFRSAVAFLYVFLALPRALGGPACALKHKNQADCIAACASRWGWPGSVMGTDRWGAVMSPEKSQSASDMLSSTCGASSSM